MGMRALGWGFGALWRGFEIFSTVVHKTTITSTVIMLVGMWVLLTLNSLVRWFGGNVSWSLEIIGYTIIWSIFVMMGPVAKQEGHIKMTFIPVRLLGERMANIYMRMVDINLLIRN